MSASTATAYRNSGDLKSANFAPPPPSPLVRRIDASRLPPRYAWTLKHFVMESQHGPDLFASTFRTSIAARVSYKTVQRHLDWLEREKILHKKHAANEFFVHAQGIRRTATYVMNGGSAKWLVPSESYKQWQRRNQRQAPSRKRPQRSPHSMHATAAPPQPAPEPTKSAPVAPSAAPPPENPILEVRRGIGNTASYFHPSRRLTRDERVALFRIYIEFKKEMSHELALAKACGELNISLESGTVALKIVVAKEQIREERRDSPTKAELVQQNNRRVNEDAKRRMRERAGKSGGTCNRHPDSGLTQWGTCWACYSEEHSGERGESEGGQGP